MPGSDIVVKIVLGIAVIAALMTMLRWIWNSRYREGSEHAGGEAAKQSLETDQERKKKASAERAQSNRDWIKRGRK